jgi:hypothetical protein
MQMKIKKKTKEVHTELVWTLGTIKRPNLQIMGIEEGEAS